MKKIDASLLFDRSIEYQLSLKDRALASTAEGITISDTLQPDNPIIYANEGFERLTGYSVKDVLGRNCRFLQGPDTDTVTKEEIRKAISEERECTVEILNYRKDGSTFWNRLSITPVKSNEGNVTNFIGIQSDVTKRKNAEEALKRASVKLESANERMKRDMDEARRLQLAMLPDSTPELPYVDIAVSMQTAYEVGGDYYDFHVDQNKTLTVSIGDATGHGLKAGTIVTATKSLLNYFVHQSDPVSILNNVSSALKKMGFRNMYMAMLIAKIEKNRLLLSSAGMPFAYFYNAADRKVSEIVLKGMPLGAFEEFPYQSQEIILSRGDTILFLSDGLPELYNENGEFFGEERVESIFYNNAKETPDKIINSLKKAAVEWVGNGEYNDDMTLMAVKMK